MLGKSALRHLAIVSLLILLPGAAAAHSPSLGHAASLAGPLVFKQSVGLTAGDGLPWDNLGQTVALDGDTALLMNFPPSAVYVFARNAGAWTQQQKLTAPDAPTFRHDGMAVSGDTILIGAPSHDVLVGSVLHRFQGVVYVFVRSGGTWTL